MPVLLELTVWQEAHLQVPDPVDVGDAPLGLQEKGVVGALEQLPLFGDGDGRVGMALL